MAKPGAQGGGCPDGRLISNESWKSIRQIEWRQPKAQNGDPYKWGNSKSAKIGSGWGKKCVIYRWVKGSTNEVVVVGETETTLAQRVNLYTSGESQHAGATNRKVYIKAEKLKAKGDFVYLEYTDSVPGFDLNNRRQRLIAESLLIGMWRPLWQF